MMNNTPNNEHENRPIKKIFKAIRWMAGVFFAIFALANGFHYSSLFFICAALLMLPLPFMSTILSKLNITSAAIILSVILLFTGVLTSPVEPDDTGSNGAPQTTTERNPAGTTSGNNTTKPNTTAPNTTTKPETTAPETTKKPTTTPNTTTKPTTTKKDDEVEMVWIASTGKGKKYHSDANCSGMIDPISISMEEAKKQGYTYCKKCYD